MIIHHLANGGYIARNGAAVQVCVGPGAGGVPLVVSFEGEALAALTAAAIAAFRERSGAWKDVVDGRRRKLKPRGVERVGSAERDAREWKKKGDGRG